MLDLIKSKSSPWKVLENGKITTDWEKIFAKHLSDKGLVTRMHIQITQKFNSKKKAQFLQWTRD